MYKRLIKVLAFILAGSLLCGCTASGNATVEDDNDGAPVLKIVDVDLTEEMYGIGVDKDKKDILKKVNEFLKKSKEDGLIDEIIGHYFGEGEPVLVESADLDPSHDQLIVASTLDFDPFEYGKVGEYYGIDMEIASHLADYMGKELVIVNSSFETMFLSVSQHKCDICIGGITITEERRQLLDFSDPYYNAAQKLVVAADNTEFDKCTTAADVEEIFNSKDKSTVVGVENMTTSQYYCEGSEEDGFPGFPMKVEGYNNAETALVALSDGNCNYVIGDNAIMERIVDRINGESGLED